MTEGLRCRNKRGVLSREPSRPAACSEVARSRDGLRGIGAPCGRAARWQARRGSQDPAIGARHPSSAQSVWSYHSDSCRDEFAIDRAVRRGHLASCYNRCRVIGVDEIGGSMTDGISTGDNVPIPLVFVGSSGEMETMATAVKSVLEDGHKLDVRHWKDAITSGQTLIEGLVALLEIFDFGLFLLTGDDILTIRGHTVTGPRDNVILELGLFTGRLGRNRTFIIAEGGDDERPRLPTDLLGVLVGRYNPVRQAATLKEQISTVRVPAEDARAMMLRLGPRPKLETGTAAAIGPTQTGIYAPPDDPWVSAFRAGVLAQIDQERVLTDIVWVVDPAHGVGRIIELDLPSGAAELIVEFRDGRRVKRPIRLLREARFDSSGH